MATKEQTLSDALRVARERSDRELGIVNVLYSESTRRAWVIHKNDGWPDNAPKDTTSIYAFEAGMKIWDYTVDRDKS